MTVNQLIEVLSMVWDARPELKMTALFKSDEPAVGQCAATSLVIQKYFGGEIFMTVASHPAVLETSTHFFNVINGKEIDATRHQFADGTVFSDSSNTFDGYSSVIDYLLSNERTVSRYESLLERVKIQESSAAEPKA